MDLLLTTAIAGLAAAAGAVAAVLIYRRGIRGLWRQIEALRAQSRREYQELRGETQALAGQVCAQQCGRREAVRFVAQGGEDLIAWRFFAGKRDGVFLEVGAYDGLGLSNTLAFEDMGWTGVLVEANPRQARRCVQNRPASCVVNAAVGGPDASGNIRLFLARDPQTGSEMLTSTNPTPELRERWQREGCEVAEEKVPCRSLAAILDEAGVGRLDLVSIDIEGGELAALQGLDLDRFRPALVAVEGVPPTSPAAEFLGAHGYRYVLTRHANAFHARTPGDGPSVGGHHA